MCVCDRERECVCLYSRVWILVRVFTFLVDYLYNGDIQINDNTTVRLLYYVTKCHMYKLIYKESLSINAAFQQNYNFF